MKNEKEKKEEEKGSTGENEAGSMSGSYGRWTTEKGFKRRGGKGARRLAMASKKKKKMREREREALAIVMALYLWKDAYTTLLATIALVLAMTIARVWKRSSIVMNKKGGKGFATIPSGPRSWPIIGNIYLLGALPHKNLAELATKYGPIFRLQLGRVPCVVVTSPAMAKEIMQTQDREFAHRPDFEVNKSISWTKSAILMASNDPAWQKARYIFATQLFSPKRMAFTEATRMEEIKAMLSRIRTKIQDDGVHDMRKVVGQLVVNNMGRVLFSKSDLGSPSNVDLMHKVSVLLGTLVYGDFIPCLSWLDRKVKARMRLAKSKLDSLFQSLIDERLKKRVGGGDNDSEILGGSKDMLDALLSTSVEGDGKHNENLIKSLALDLLGGGVDTSTAVLEWAMTELLRHPSTLKRLQEEIDLVVGDECLVEHSHIPKLPYLNSVIKETLRLHPPLPLLVPHFSPNSSHAGGYIFPAKAIIFINMSAIGRDPNIWGKDALEFKPERFMPNEGSMDKFDVHGKNFEYIPFGSGRRICPGMALGLRMIEVGIANLVNSFNWSLPPGVQPEDINMTEKPGLTIHKREPLLAIAKIRHNKVATI